MNSPSALAHLNVDSAVVGPTGFASACCVELTPRRRRDPVTVQAEPDEEPLHPLRSLCAKPHIVLILASLVAVPREKYSRPAERPYRHTLDEPLEDLAPFALNFWGLVVELRRGEIRAPRTPFRGRHAVPVLAAGGSGAYVTVVAFENCYGLCFLLAPVIGAARASRAAPFVILAVVGDGRARSRLARLTLGALGVVSALRAEVFHADALM
jgi:hypothetical protein